MPHPDTPATHAIETLPRHTTPTWEVELLISGVAVFAMLQLPSWLGEHLLTLMPRFVTSLGTMLLLFYEYLTCAAIILATTFALHLMLRAYWIALVGLHSVFPDDILWARLRMGPQLREFLQRHDHGPAQRIERADNRATVIFAFGVTIAMIMLALSAAALLTFAITMVIVISGNQRVDAIIVFAVVVVLIMFPLLLTMLLDRLSSQGLRQGGRFQRGLAKVYGCYRWVGILPGFSTLRLLESHVGSRRFQWLTSLVILPAAFVVVAIFMAGIIPLRFGSYSLFPHFANQNAHVITTAHYDDTRDLAHDPAVPYIQGAVVIGPYLKLVVPYTPDRDAAALRRGCPAPTHDDSARALARLACLGALHPVSLDAMPLSKLHYVAASDPRTDRPALLAMIDVRLLAPGQHVLRVTRAPKLAGDANGHDADKAWIIPFWR